MAGIVACGAYLPRLRLERKAIFEANAWFAPGLRGAARGARSMANWDEDALTMAVEAGRACLLGADPLRERRRRRRNRLFALAAAERVRQALVRQPILLAARRTGDDEPAIVEVDCASHLTPF